MTAVSRTLLIVFAALTAVGASASLDRPALSRIIHDTLGVSSFKLAEADLNGDGKAEIVIYATDKELCGSGGCRMFVLSPRGTRFRIVAKTTVTNLPIRLLATSTHGWRDLGVTVRGGGLAVPFEARLRFDGHRYPSNPSIIRPAAHQLDGATLLGE